MKHKRTTKLTGTVCASALVLAGLTFSTFVNVDTGLPNESMGGYATSCNDVCELMPCRPGIIDTWT